MRSGNPDPVEYAGVRLRLATLNVWALPLGLSRDTSERVRAIGEGLAELELDVAAFQEAWTRASREGLAAAGRRAGLAHAWHSGGGLGGGGLLVLSRLAIEQKRFETYGARGLPERVWHGDYHAGKGFSELWLTTAIGDVVLVNTHLHSQYERDPEDDYRGHRMAQVVQLAARLRDIRAPVVAVGDFNLREDQPHYRALTGLGGLSDTAVVLGARQPTVRATNPYARDRPRPDARIDYVFVRDGEGLGIRPLALERVFDARLDFAGRPASYSDHAGLRALVELRRGAEAAGASDEEALASARALLEAGRDAAEERRRRRWGAAAAGLGGASLAWLGTRRAAHTRRAALRWLAAGAGTLALGAGAACQLASGATPEEVRAFDDALARLDQLGAGR